MTELTNSGNQNYPKDTADEEEYDGVIEGVALSTLETENTDINKYDVLGKKLLRDDYYTTSRRYWISKHAVERIYKNQNFMAIFVGPVGSGKSYSAIATYEDIVGVENLKIENICFTAREFVMRLNSGELKKGDVLVFEEAGVSIARREWFSIQNKIIGYITQTFRRNNINVLFTTPTLGFIDSNVACLMHGFCEMLDPASVGGKFGIAKYKEFKVKSSSREINEVYPYVTIRGKRVQLRPQTSQSGNVFFKMPEDKDFLKEYEHKKKAYVDGLMVDLESMMEEKKSITNMNIEEITDVLMSNPRMYFGVMEEEGKKQSLGHISNICYTKLAINFPDYSFRKGDVTSALAYLYNMGIVTGRFPRAYLNDYDDLLLVKRLMKEKRWDAVMVAKHYNIKAEVLKRQIEEWGEKGLWK